MKPITYRTACVLACLLFPACNDSTAPPPPPLGRQIDRMGRAAINTALIQPFTLDAGARGRGRDAFNTTPQAQWQIHAPEIARNLGIYDGIDQACGNQLVAGPTATAGRYNMLASILADDQLYVNTDSGQCNQYLAVEANAVGIRNSDCGGRTPLYDTIDTTYSVLVAGALAGVTDGVPRDADPSPANPTTFPFLGNPN